MKQWLLVLLALTLSASAVAAEAAIQRKDLPAAVEKAVQQEEAKGARVRGISAEKRAGATVYEIETINKGRTRDLIVDATGQILEAEDEVSIDAVPEPVRAVLLANGKVIKIEALTRGANTIYEALVEKNGKKSEVAVDATGKRVKS